VRTPPPASAEVEREVMVEARRDGFEAQLEALGFRLQGESRRGGRMWLLAFNRHLDFVLHDYADAVVLSWSFGLGDFVLERGWRIGVTDASVAELYPQADVRLPMDVHAVEGEIRRVLTTLRLDLGAPDL
jgi:hypothetical protein